MTCRPDRASGVPPHAATVYAQPVDTLAVSSAMYRQ